MRACLAILSVAAISPLRPRGLLDLRQLLRNAGGACRGPDITGLAKRNKKGRLPALRRSAGTGWPGGGCHRRPSGKMAGIAV